MDKRFQVFVSSTFTDLQEARGHVFQTLMSMDCFPAGMELFPAMDEEQFDFIKRVIDDSDYYLLIMGGRYGSLSPAGLSYTEMEFDYAIEKGLKVLAFLHEKPEDIPAKFTESDPQLRDKLAAFREKVSTGRLVNFWQEPQQLSGLVSLSLNKTMRTYPAVGWVRANKVSSEQALFEQNQMLKELDRLREENNRLVALQKPEISNIAGLNEEVEMDISWKEWSTYAKEYIKKHSTVKLTWLELYRKLAPELMNRPNDAAVNYLLGAALLRTVWPQHEYAVAVGKEAFNTVRIQLLALGFISTDWLQTTKGEMALFWSLTEIGKKTMYETVAVRSQIVAPSP